MKPACDGVKCQDAIAAPMSRLHSPHRADSGEGISVGYDVWRLARPPGEWLSRSAGARRKRLCWESTVGVTPLDRSSPHAIPTGLTQEHRSSCPNHPPGGCEFRPASNPSPAATMPSRAVPG